VVERLHHVFVGSGVDRLADVSDVVLGGAEDDLGRAPVGPPAQLGEELDPAHHRHVPVEQDHVGHGLVALGERFLAVRGLVHRKAERLDNVPRNLADHPRIIDDQAILHGPRSLVAGVR
jgi:hypothetical protein